MENTTLRPIYNIYHEVMIIGVLLTLIAISTKRLPKYTGVILLSFYLGMASLSGTRSVLLGGVVGFVFSLLMAMSYTNMIVIRPLRFFSISLLSILGLVIIAVAIGEIREGRYDIQNGFMIFFARVFFGNTFSDLRDFSWVLSNWDGHLLWGKSLLAGMLSFIPASMSEFRQNWGWGRVTTTIVGLDSAIHPGLRGGMFAENYLNFGVGVAFIAFAYGVIIGNISRALQCALHGRTVSHSLTHCLSALLIVQIFGCFFDSSGFFGVYIILGILIIGQIGARGPIAEVCE